MQTDKISMVGGNPTLTTLAVGQGAALPSTAVQGQLFFLTTTKEMMFYNGTAWKSVTDVSSTTGPAGVTYDVGFDTDGKPIASQTWFYNSVRGFVISDFSTAIAKAGAASTSAAVFTIKKGATQVATLTFAAGSTTGTFSSIVSTPFLVGEVLSIAAPATQDATLSNLSVTIPVSLTAGANIQLIQTTVPFGEVLKSTSNVSTLLIKNIGDSNITDLTAVITGDAGFTITTNPCAAITIGATCGIVITFAASATDFAAKTATLTIMYAGGRSRTVTLTGTSATSPGDQYYDKVLVLMHMDSAASANSSPAASTYPVTVVGASGYRTTPRFGTGSYLATATTQALMLPAFNPLNSFTVEMWVYPLSQGYNIWSTGGIASSAWQSMHIWVDGSTSQFKFYANSSGVTGGQDITSLNSGVANSAVVFGSSDLNAWSHLAVVRDVAAQEWRLYKNGVLGTTIKTNLQPYSSPYNQVISNYPTTSQTAFSTPFNGYVDELRITDGVARYTGSTFTVPTAAFPDKKTA